MLKQLIKKTAYTIAPRWSAQLDDRWWLQKNARELMRRAAECDSADQYLRALDSTRGFPAWQNRGEILALLDVVADLCPRHACEIGSMEGGTLFLLTQMCHPDAHVISLDWSYTEARRRTFPQFARHRQRLSLVEADSHDPATRARVQNLLDGDPLDFLFIDGDHCYAGVAQDFETFAPLVRPGGVVAFHDILPDDRARGRTPSLRDRYPDTREFVDDPDQDGCGIGMIRWPGKLADVH